MRRRFRNWWVGVPGWTHAAVLALAALGLILLGALVLKWIPAWLATGGLRGPDRAEEIGRTRTAVLGTIAGLIALTGAVFTGLSYRLNREGQITDRFTKAIEQIGRKELEVRLGGIYALERIARDSAADHPQVFEVLTAYVRERSVRPDGHKLTADVNAAMRVIGRRDVSQDAGPRLYLADTDLRGLALSAGRANLPRVVLRGATLDDVLLDEADLRDARLERAHLARVRFEDSDLELAKFEGADLTGAKIVGTKLTRAGLEHARLARCLIQRTNLSRARLDGVDLTDARLEDVDLRAGYLYGATLRGAILNDVDLRGANLGGADLLHATLQGCVYDDATRWPEGYAPGEHGARKG